MSMHHAVIINYYFLVHMIEVEKLTLLSTHVSLKCNEVSWHNSQIERAQN